MVIFMLFKYFNYGRMKDDLTLKEGSPNSELNVWCNYGYCNSIFYFYNILLPRNSDWVQHILSDIFYEFKDTKSTLKTVCIIKLYLPPPKCIFLEGRKIAARQVSQHFGGGGEGGGRHFA